VLESVWPNPYVVSAAEVLPEIREFERTSTAVLNGYVQPLIHRYLRALMDTLRGRGYAHDVLTLRYGKINDETMRFSRLAKSETVRSAR